MIRVEKCLFKDMGHLTNMEIATQEFALTQDEVKPYVMDKGKDAWLAKVGTRVVGYVLATLDEKDNVVILDSIGVHPNFRKVGVGKRLVEHLSLQAHAAGHSKVITFVADYLIEDKDDPWNIEHWLWRMGFKAAGVMHNECFRYGRYCDLYIFERQK